MIKSEMNDELERIFREEIYSLKFGIQEQFKEEGLKREDASGGWKCKFNEYKKKKNVIFKY